MKNTYEIALVPGDGIGPEVCDAAVRVIEAACRSDIGLNLKTYRAGATCYRDIGGSFPEETFDGCRKAHAILHGGGGRPFRVLSGWHRSGSRFWSSTALQTRSLRQYRPIKLYAGVRSPLAGNPRIDYVIVRENTEGLYSSRGGGTLLRDEVATDTMIITLKGTERVARVAAELAMQRSGAPADGKRRVTICDKSNVLHSFAFFRKVGTETLKSYKEIETDYILSDAMTAHLIEQPGRLDVVVCENLIGDLISDLGAATVGGMGMSPSAENR